VSKNTFLSCSWQIAPSNLTFCFKHGSYRTFLNCKLSQQVHSLQLTCMAESIQLQGKCSACLDRHFTGCLLSILKTAPQRELSSHCAGLTLLIFFSSFQYTFAGLYSFSNPQVPLHYENISLILSKFCHYKINLPNPKQFFQADFVYPQNTS